MQGCLALFAASLPLVALMSLPPALPKLLMHFAHVPHTAVLAPMVAAAPGACVALFAPFAGLFADRIGRRRMVLAAVAVFSASGLVPLLLDDLWLILASRLVLGLANAILLTVGTTLIGDYFEGEARRRWLAFNGVMGSLLITLSMLVGGLLADWTWRGPFLLHLVGLPMFALCYWRLFEPSQRHDEAIGAAAGADAFPWSALLSMALLTLACATLFYAEALQIGLVLDQIGLKSASRIAIVGALASLGYPFGAMVFSRLSGRWSEAGLQILSWVLFAIGLMGVGQFKDFRMVCLAGILQQTGAGVLMTLLIHQCYERFPYRYRARGMGVWVSFFFAGQFASPLVVSAIAAVAGGLRPAIVVLGALALGPAAFAAALGCVGVLRPEPARGQPGSASLPIASLSPDPKP
jgi:MFS family permease